MAKVGDVGTGFGAGGIAPSAPTLSVSVSGTTATATIDGDAGVTNWLYYKVSTATEWSTAPDKVLISPVPLPSLIVTTG